MKKFNEVIYNKLLLQAEEARDQKLIKLAQALESALKEESSQDISEYSSDELHEDVYKDLWSAAANVIKYYNIESVDVVKVSQALEDITNVVIESVKNSIDIDSTIGPLEPKLPGESK